MEQNIIKIKCPYCGAVLSLRDVPGINEKSATCPICKQKNKIGECKRVENRKEEETVYPTGNDSNEKRTTDIIDEGKTQVSTSPVGNFTLGRLMVLPAGPSYQLNLGRNIVGRKVENPPQVADFGLSTNSKRMSRQHLLVEVKKVSGIGIAHYVSLCGQRTNATFVGDNRLEVGDCLVLNKGDIIRLPDQPDIRVRFEIPDNDETQIDDY